MSYTPTNWQTGDTITADKLNNIEQGLFEAVDSIIILNDKVEPFIVTLTPTAQDFSGTMDKTPAEIRAAYDAGRQIVFDIPAMSASVIPQEFLLAGDDSILVCGQIVYTMSGQMVLISIATATSAQTYATDIFQLTHYIP